MLLNLKRAVVYYTAKIQTERSVVRNGLMDQLAGLYGRFEAGTDVKRVRKRQQGRGGYRKLCGHETGNGKLPASGRANSLQTPEGNVRSCLARDERR